MWATFFNLVKRVFSIDEELNRLRADLKEVRGEMRDLTTAMTRLHYEMQVL